MRVLLDVHPSIRWFLLVVLIIFWDKHSQRHFWNKNYQDYYHKVRPRDPRHHRCPQIEVQRSLSESIALFSRLGLHIFTFVFAHFELCICSFWSLYLLILIFVFAHFEICFCSFWSLFLLIFTFVFAHFDLCICFVTNPKWEIGRKKTRQGN